MAPRYAVFLRESDGVAPDDALRNVRWTSFATGRCRRGEKTDEENVCVRVCRGGNHRVVDVSWRSRDSAALDVGRKWKYGLKEQE